PWLRLLPPTASGRPRQAGLGRGAIDEDAGWIDAYPDVLPGRPGRRRAQLAAQLMLADAEIDIPDIAQEIGDLRLALEYVRPRKLAGRRAQHFRPDDQIDHGADRRVGRAATDFDAVRQPDAGIGAVRHQLAAQLIGKADEFGAEHG